MDQYTEAYYQDQAYAALITEAYQGSLQSLGTQNSFDAMVTFMTSTCDILLMWYGLQEIMAANTMDALSAMQSDLNTIQSAYDNYVSTGDTSQLQDAIDAANDINEIATNDPAIADSSIGSDITTQLDTIMGSDNPSKWTVSNLDDYWADSSDAASGTQNVDDSTSSATDSVQPITNAFTALSTDFSNLSSTSQSSMQYYSSCQQQMEGLDETLMQDWATEEQTMINNQVTS